MRTYRVFNIHSHVNHTHDRSLKPRSAMLRHIARDDWLLDGPCGPLVDDFLNSVSGCRAAARLAVWCRSGGGEGDDALNREGGREAEFSRGLRAQLARTRVGREP